MSPSNTNNVVSIIVKQFPQNLIIPGEKNIVSLQITNSSTKEENFLLEFEGENLDVKVLSIGFDGEIRFSPNETKNVELNLIPKTDGFGKLITNIYSTELIKYREKVQKVRVKPSGANLNKILKGLNLLTTETIRSFNPQTYMLNISKDELKQLEKKVKLLSQDLKSSNSSKKAGIEIENHFKQLAKAYLFYDEFYKSLETSLEISNEQERIEFYYNLLRAYASKNVEACLDVVKNLGDLKRKNQALANIAMDIFDKNPEEVLKLISFIDDNDFKEKALLNVIGKAASQNNMPLVLKYTQLIGDNTSRIKLLFNVIKTLDDNNNKGLILPILNEINKIILNSETINIDNQNSIYKYLEASIWMIAELDCPQSADSLIKEIRQDDLRNKVIKELFDELYEIVDDVKTKLEKKIALSQFYSVNTYVSRISKEIRNFSLIGGNLSNNLLLKDYEFNFALISLFSFTFSVFPIIDRLYHDFNYHSKKSFAYYIFPSISNHDEEEINIIKQTLVQFFSPSKITNQITIFNLDFIPYLGQPTVILSEEENLNHAVKAKFEKHMKDKAEILVSDEMFKGGDAQYTLKDIFQAKNFTVINLILSYEFLNNYEIFKLFIEALI